MNFNEQLNKVTHRAFDFFFPKKCPFCGAVTGISDLCDECRRNLPFTAPETLVEEDFGLCASPLYYEGRVQKTIDDYLIKGKMNGLNVFGQLMAQCAAEVYTGMFDTVSWVPLSEEEKKRQHCDSKRYLAASLCVDWHTKPVETLRAEERDIGLCSDQKKIFRPGSEKVYKALEKNTRRRKILLIDDVYESGTVLRECTKVLKEAGADNVVCLTLARKRFNIDTTRK